jgi:hypothetical protein
MCYGDIGHGKNGYYQRWVEEQLEREADEAEAHSQEGKE